ncbi:MAG: class I SAM-dependent methyltransferase [Dorea longicatena]
MFIKVFLVGDSENLPFENESFDVVICTNSFHHYPNPHAFMNEASRVLKNGGKHGKSMLRKSIFPAA